MDIDTPPKPARRAKRIYKSRPMIEDSDEDTSNLPTVTVLRTPAPVKAATKAPPSKPSSSAPQRPHRDAQRPLHPNLAAAARAIEDNESDEDYDGDRIESKDASDGGDDPDVDEKDELGESEVDEEFRPQRKAPRKRSRRPAKPSKPKVPKTPKAVTDAPKACSHCVRKNVRCQIDGPGSACLECWRVKSRCPLSTEQRLQAVEGGLSTLQATTSRIEAKVDWVMDRLSEWMQLFDEYPEDDYDEAIRQKLALRGGVQAQQPATSVRQSPPPQAPPVEEEESLEDAIEDAYADAPPETVEPAEEATGQHEPGDPDEPTTNVTPAAASPRISPPCHGLVKPIPLTILG
ncbi:hypothetical protein ONZ45_g17586 [Pleurotus djamor]|nr:hypothetical protein ONZ45_g17586 [Pleurotus djamor]